jgi:hypothetical protein
MMRLGWTPPALIGQDQHRGDSDAGKSSSPGVRASDGRRPTCRLPTPAIGGSFRAAAARKLIEIANSVKPVQDVRIYIELINGPMLFELKATPAEYGAGRDYAVAKGWLELDRSGTFVRFTQAGAELFA